MNTIVIIIRSAVVVVPGTAAPLHDIIALVCQGTKLCSSKHAFMLACMYMLFYELAEFN
jgi:hypothetical protein